MVSITYDNEHICGGFIYNAKWIVTAASCFDGYVLPLNVNWLLFDVLAGSNALICRIFFRNPVVSRLRVVLGQKDIITPGQDKETISVFRVVKFDFYNPASKSNDTALVEVILILVTAL